MTEKFKTNIVASDSMGQGSEVICRAEDCAHNDRPICKAHTIYFPLTIGESGKCVNYIKKEVSGK